MAKKAAIQLSLTYIIGVILGISVFFAIMVMNQKIFHQTKEFKSKIDAETEKEILNIFKLTSHNFVVPFRVVTVHPGEDAAFPVGVRNVLKNRTDCTEFYIRVDIPSSDVVGYDKLKNEIKKTEVDTLSWLYKETPGDDHGEYGPYKIPLNSIETFPVVISVPKTVKLGMYVFTFSVTARNPNGGIPCDTSVYPKIKAYVRVE